ncbi:hypothetical protein [Absidia glauca]|uniref:Uncharacterized protein n=1 Tax=Absidia glauca TaxID=4829 RepID=A0A163KSK7_ABSGL|nr:hypothetical protein [Absidia glauca]
MSNQRSHQTHSAPLNGWDSYFSSRASSLLESSNNKRHPCTDATSIRKRSRLVEVGTSSKRKDMLPASIPTLTSTVPRVSSRPRSTLEGTSSASSIHKGGSIDSILKRMELPSTQQPRIVKRNATMATSLYPQQDGNSSDESIDTYLKRIENGTAKRPKHKPKVDTDRQQQQQQEDDNDSDESIETYLERIDNGTPRRPKHKSKADPYQQPVDDDLPLSDTTTPQPCTTTTQEDTVTQAATMSSDDTYYGLFGKHREPSQPKKQRNKRQRQTSIDDQQQPSLDMKTILEAISVEPLPKSVLNNELDFFAEEDPGTRKIKKQQQRRRKHTLANGFSGFSDEEEGSSDDALD